MCKNFLQQMKIDALEQLISEDVNVQGQIVRDGFRTCLMVFRIIAGVVVGVVTRGDAVYHHSSVVVVAGGVRTHLNACGPLLPLSRGKNCASPRWASLESTNFVLARVYGYLPWPDEEPTSSMERRGRHTGVAFGDDSCRCGTSLSWPVQWTAPRKNLHLESRADPVTETRWKPEKGIEGRRPAKAFIKKVWRRK
jgi:hypothetical protein